MEVRNITTLMDDPLAGCLAVVQNETNGRSMLGSLLLRLRLYYPETVSNNIGDQLIKESDAVLMNRWEYVINECLYELRLKRKDYSSMFETVVLNNWVKDLLKRYPENDVLDFVGVVKRNRGGRVR